MVQYEGRAHLLNCGEREVREGGGRGPGKEAVGHKGPGKKAVGHKGPGKETVGHKGSPGKEAMGHKGATKWKI